MKIKFIILAGFILATLALKAQNSFEFTVQDTSSSKCFTTFVDEQNFFVSVGSIGSPIIHEYDGMILRYENPDFIVKTIFHKPDSIIFFRYGILLSNGNYFIAGTVDSNEDTNLKNLYILELSPEMEIVRENIYGIPLIYNRLSLDNLILGPDSIVVINGTLDDPAPGLLNDLYAARLNTQGELLDILISDDFNSDYSGEIITKLDNSGYYFIGEFGYARLIDLDNNLNIIGYQPMDPDNSYSSVAVRRLADGNLVIGSLAHQDVGSFYDLRMRVCGIDLEPIKDTIIIDDGFNWLPVLSGLDFIDENNIWVVTYPQMVKSTSDWEFGRIYIFDSNLNVKGAKYFGGTTPLYLYSLKALDDGGCIITGITPDDEGKGYSDVYIKKVMPDDILTHAEETIEPDDQDVLVYPIPFSNELSIETYRRNLTFSLFYIDGKCVVSNQKLTIPNTRIETSNLEKGNYIYKISTDGKTIQTGKIIKR
ncbi:MAG: T9SS type A sorting domain-containing protein [Bacteroidales bacterium]